MLDDFNTAENVYLSQRKQMNNTKVHITFDQTQKNIIQIDKLLQCLEFGDYKKEINFLSIFTNNHEDGENEEQKIINESKTGKTIHTLILEFPKSYLNSNDGSRLINFTYFCPNLISIHIIIETITQQNIIELLANISTHLSQLREIQFEMKYPIRYTKTELQIITYLSKIKTIQSINLNLNLLQLTIHDWKFIYSELKKLKKLNTLILTSPPQPYQIIKPNEKQISYSYHKKLIRLVNKAISVYPNYPNEQEEDDIDIGQNLLIY